MGGFVFAVVCLLLMGGYLALGSLIDDRTGWGSDDYDDKDVMR